jgi:hypothetical protein
MRGNFFRGVGQKRSFIRGVSAFGLFSTTILGCLLLQWTRWDRPHPLWPSAMQTGFVPHTVVLGLWTLAWIQFWSLVLNRRGGGYLVLAVSFAAAAVAEGVQRYFPGHDPNVTGVFYNLIGVACALAINWRRIKTVPPPVLPSFGK